MDKIDPDLIPVLIGSFFKKVRKNRNEMLAAYKLSSSHVMYLMVLYKNSEGLTLSNLNEILEVDKANTTRVVKDLIKKGYLIKDEKNLGLRKYKVLLTDKGTEISRKIKNNIKLVHEKINAILNEEEKQNFFKILKKFNDFEF